MTFATGQSSKFKTHVATGTQGILPGEEIVWNFPKLVDLAGDGKLVSSPPGKVAKLLPDVQGVQQVIWEHLPDKPTRGVGRCYSFEGGAGNPRLVWHIDEMTGPITSEVICADIDGNGSDEFLATTYNQLICLRSAAKPGPRLKWKVELPTMPSELAVADVDNDGLPEIIYTGTDGYLHCLGSRHP